MTALTLAIGNKNYSSWSMRAWLLLRWLEADFDEKLIMLYRSDSRAAVLPFSPSAKLPALIDGDLRVWDSLAIVMHMAERDRRVWPADAMARAYAQSICAEMHSGFMALRDVMPHNGRGRDRRVPMTPALQADIERIVQIWTEGLARFGGPWLAGGFGTADIFYAPVAGRFRTYGVALEEPAAGYCAALLAHPLVVQWYAEGAGEEEIHAGEAGRVEPEAAAL